MSVLARTDEAADRPTTPEPVHVRIRSERGSELPDLMLWADRLWLVQRVIARQIVPSDLVGAIAEHVWWVQVSAGRSGPTRVCELRQAYPSGHWRLYAVVDDIPDRLRPVPDAELVRAEPVRADPAAPTDRSRLVVVDR